MKPTTPILAGYPEFFEDIKQRIQAARVSAARAINRELILLYWDIGEGILSRQRDLGWGEAVVEALAKDLRSAFPQSRGFSARNVWDMRRMVEAYTDPQFLRCIIAELGKLLKDKAPASKTPTQAEILRDHIAEIPWTTHLILLNKVSDPVARSYYLTATARMGWTGNVRRSSGSGDVLRRMPNPQKPPPGTPSRNGGDRDRRLSSPSGGIPGGDPGECCCHRMRPQPS